MRRYPAGADTGSGPEAMERRWAGGRFARSGEMREMQGVVVEVCRASGRAWTDHEAVAASHPSNADARMDISWAQLDDAVHSQRTDKHMFITGVK